MHIRTLLAAIIALLVLSGCSSDEPVVKPLDPLVPDENYDPKSFVRLMDPASDLTLVCREVKTYHLNRMTRKWELLDGEMPDPCRQDLLIIRDGKIYSQPIFYVPPQKPSVLALTIDLLRRTKKIDSNREILTETKYDLNEGTISFDVAPFYIKNITSSDVYLLNLANYLGYPVHKNQDDIEFGQLVERRYEICGPYSEQFYGFQSKIDIYTWAMDIFHKNFDESDDLYNNYYDGMDRVECEY